MKGKWIEAQFEGSEDWYQTKVIDVEWDEEDI